MNKEELFGSGLLEMYVLGLTSPEEARQVEALARKNPEIQKEIDELRRALENYAAEHSIPPPPDLKRRVLNRVDNQGQSIPSSGQAILTRSSRSGWLVLSTLAFLLSTVFFFLQSNSRQHRINNLIEEKQQLSAACEAQQDAYRQTDRVIAFLENEHTLPVQLKGSPVSPEATALVFWNEARKEVMFSPQGLPAPPSGKQYQLWADVDGEMINMGLVAPEEKGLQEMNYIARAESVNLTLEPLGGSEHPTVALLYANAML